MLTRRARAAGTAVMLILTAVLAPAGPSAAARAPGAGCPIGQANCDAWDNDDGTPGVPSNGGGSTKPDESGGNGGGSRVCRTDSGVVKPCHDDVLGWFNSGDDCYYKRFEPQPPGVEAGKTAYLRSCVEPPSQNEVFLAAAPGGFEPPDPLELANDLLVSIVLEVPEIVTAPQGRPGLVGVPVWLHDAASWEPKRNRKTEGGVTVEITANPEKIVYDMGNGADPVVCTSAGTSYEARFHPRAKVPGRCVYDGYSKAGTYTITAVKSWTVPWTTTSGGAGAPLSTSRRSTTTIEIDELQVVTG